MKSRISALMDGELEREDAKAPLDALSGEGEAREAWRTYHLIADVMSDTRLLSQGFAARVAERLGAEPTVIAPGAIAAPARRARWAALSAAASVAAVALVGWLAFAPQGGDGPPAAQAPREALAETEPAQVPPPETAAEYLLAHQGYSPRNSLQGVAPYVRTVSNETGARKQ